MRISDWSSDVCSSDLPEFGAQVAGLQDGGVSAPFKTQAGWHIVQREETRQTDVTDDNRRAKMRERIGQRKLEDEWNRFLREMRGDAYENGKGHVCNTVTNPHPVYNHLLEKKNKF